MVVLPGVVGSWNLVVIILHAVQDATVATSVDCTAAFVLPTHVWPTTEIFVRGNVRPCVRIRRNGFLLPWGLFTSSNRQLRERWETEQERSLDFVGCGFFHSKVALYWTTLNTTTTIQENLKSKDKQV